MAQKLRLALERGWATRLPDLLAAFEKRKEREIEQLCSRYYNGYLDSVQQLVHMRSDRCVCVQQPL